jgi:hypothetical protein
VERVVVTAQDQVVTTHDLKINGPEKILEDGEAKIISLSEAVAETEKRVCAFRRERIT